MAKRRRKQKQVKKTNTHSSNDTIGGLEVQEEAIAKTEETIKHKESKAKPLEKLSSEKVESAPQTYVEDTFDLDNQTDNEVEIKNEIKAKEKVYVSREELFENPIFKHKLHKAKARVQENKGFDFLLDFVSSSKAYKSYEVDETHDDFDILLGEISKHFSLRLARLSLSYKEYQEITWYFERLRNIYNEFKHSEMVKRKELNQDLEKMKSMSNLIRWTLF